MPLILLVSIAYWSEAPSSRRRSSRMRVAWERLRARRKFGTAMEASNAMMATTIMISTRVNAFELERYFIVIVINFKVYEFRGVLRAACGPNTLFRVQSVFVVKNTT